MKHKTAVNSFQEIKPLLLLFEKLKQLKHF
jgi:hypothetical protein